MVIPPPKKIGRFFLLVLLTYALLMAPWPGIQRGYAFLFRTGANLVFSHSFWFWPDGRVYFLDLHSPDQVSGINAVITGTLPPGYKPLRPEGVKDTLMVITNRRAPATFGQIRTSSRYVSFSPTAMLLGLILATPLPWRQRGWAFLWGCLLIQLFAALQLTLTILAVGFAAEKEYALLHPSPFWRGLLTKMESVVSDDPTISFVVPALVWFLVALRRYLRGASQA